MASDTHIAHIHAQKHRNSIDLGELTPVDCNLCGTKSSENKKLFSEDSQFDVMKCHQCNLVYVTPQPNHEDLHKYYEGFFSTAENTSSDEWLHETSLAQIKKILDDKVTDREAVLEIGSGNGFFLKMAERLKFKKIVGVEPDPDTCSAVVKKLSTAQIVNSSFEDFTTDDKFSCIVMLASLEHFKNPTHILEKCHSLLKAGGIIIIRVPYWEGYFQINALMKRSIFTFGAPRHLYDFSPKTLTALCKKVGFETMLMLPGAKEKQEKWSLSIMVSILKGIFFGLFHLSFKRYISSFTGSIVAIAKKT
ncbi:MAG: class I SAM-dependent methyltransferase [Colwellia sp.]